MTDVCIIGGGPAALGAALYAARSGLSAVVFEKKFVGGQASTTHDVDNYLGFSDDPSGAELAERMRAHVEKFPVKFKFSSVKALELDKDIKKIYTAKAEFETRSVILAMGASPRPLGLDGEDALKGKGVSYCATCDGMFFKGKSVAVVGGGDTAVSDAIYLAPICEKVYLIHRRNEFRAAAVDVEKLRRCENVEFVTESRVTALHGADFLSSITVETKDGTREIEVSGLFVAVGTIPETELVKGKIKLDESGFIITDEEMKTSAAGVFAAGDIRRKPLRQIITAVADGAVAASSAAKYLR